MSYVSKAWLEGWVQDAQEKNRPSKHPPGGIYNKKAQEITNYLLKNSKDPLEALRRLLFYMNRAGSKLSDEGRTELQKAKKILQQKVKEEREKK